MFYRIVINKLFNCINVWWFLILLYKVLSFFLSKASIITTKPIGFSILGKLHIGPMMV